MQLVTLLLNNLKANPKASRRTLFVGGLFLLILLLLLLLYRYWQYTKSPDYVLHRALHDIEIGDINDLYAISNQDACKYLHITPQNARFILQQTLWAHGFPQDPTCEPFGPVPEGERQWVITWKRPHFKVRQQMAMLILEQPNGSWRVDLPLLLQMACVMANKSYKLLALSGGITGSEIDNRFWDLQGHLMREPGMSNAGLP